MTATTYYATTADERLAQAQWILDTHVTSSATGRCLACGAPGQCEERIDAVSVFFRTTRLPHRRPGATRPELIAAALGPAGKSWFTVRPSNMARRGWTEP